MKQNFMQLLQTNSAYIISSSFMKQASEYNKFNILIDYLYLDVFNCKVYNDLLYFNSVF